MKNEIKFGAKIQMFLVIRKLLKETKKIVDKEEDDPEKKRKLHFLACLDFSRGITVSFSNYILLSFMHNKRVQVIF